MNPDELLAAYAAARAKSPAGGSVGLSIETQQQNQQPSPPSELSPVAGQSNAHLRPTSTAGESDRNPFRNSMVSDVSAYSATTTGVDAGRK